LYNKALRLSIRALIIFLQKTTISNLQGCVKI